ncbi:MAG: GGDEF domain-containing protein [Candidatus Omnitrophota bacterium]
MHPIAGLLILLFVLINVWLGRLYAKGREQTAVKRVTQAKKDFDHIQRQKERIIEEKKSLEKQAGEIFTLYEMTQEITTQHSELQAFKVFQEQLKASVDVQECQFVHIHSPEYEAVKTNEDYFLFEVKEKNKRLGYLAFKGLLAKDQEKALILSHQFAMALRRVKLYEEVEALAITDSLTQTHTRRYFMDRFEEEIKRANNRKTELSFFIIDVDRFKGFNDKYGHLVGDQILKEIAALIKENVREIDILGRYGGEEFCVVLPDTDHKGAHFAAERIRQAVGESTIKSYDAIVKATVSIGTATTPADGRLPSELIDKADWALYRAKKRGRNCVCSFGIYN